MNNDFVQSGTEALETAFTSNNNNNRPKSSQNAPEMSLEWVMAKMDVIIHDNAYIADTLKALNLMDSDGHNSKAQALGEVIQAREATNRETLRFLEKIYDGLKPIPVDPGSVLKHLDVTALSNNLESEHVVEIVRALAGK